MDSNHTLIFLYFFYFSIEWILVSEISPICLPTNNSDYLNQFFSAFRLIKILLIENHSTPVILIQMPWKKPFQTLSLLFIKWTLTIYLLFLILNECLSPKYFRFQILSLHFIMNSNHTLTLLFISSFFY